MQIQLVNHCKIGQGFQGREAVLFFHYTGASLLNIVKRNSYILKKKKKVKESEWKGF